VSVPATSIVEKVALYIVAFFFDEDKVVAEFTRHLKRSFSSTTLKQDLATARKTARRIFSRTRFIAILILCN